MDRIQAFQLLKRRDDLSLAQFNAHWRGVHASLIAALPDYWKRNENYVQNMPLPMPESIGGEPAFDGIAQAVRRVDDAGQTREFYDDSAYLECIRPDERAFLSLRECTVLIARQHVIKDGPRTPVKYLSLLRPAAGFTHDTFLQYWRHRHAPLVADVAPFWRRIRRYVQSHGIPQRYRSLVPGGLISRFSGVAEIWFDSVEDLTAAFGDAEYLARVRPDERRFIAVPTTRFMLEEYPVAQARRAGS